VKVSDQAGGQTATDKEIRVAPPGFNLSDRRAITTVVTGSSDRPGQGVSESAASQTLRNDLFASGFGFRSATHVAQLDALGNASNHETHEQYSNGTRSAGLRIASGQPNAFIHDAAVSTLTLLKVSDSGAIVSNSYPVASAADLLAVLDANRAGMEYFPGSSPSTTRESLSLSASVGELALPSYSALISGQLSAEMLDATTVAAAYGAAISGLTMSLFGWNWWCAGAWTLKLTGYAVAAGLANLACAPLCVALGFATAGVDRSGYRAGGADRTDVDEVLLTAICRC
jgi:hypothetical protein